MAGIYYALVISLRHVYSHAVARLIANCRTYYISLNNVSKRKNIVKKKEQLNSHDTTQNKMKVFMPYINRNLGKMLKFIYMF